MILVLCSQPETGPFDYYHVYAHQHRTFKIRWQSLHGARIKVCGIKKTKQFAKYKAKKGKASTYLYSLGTCFGHQEAGL